MPTGQEEDGSKHGAFAMRHQAWQYRTFVAGPLGSCEESFAPGGSWLPSSLMGPKYFTSLITVKGTELEFNSLNDWFIKNRCKIFLILKCILPKGYVSTWALSGSGPNPSGNVSLETRTSPA